MKNFIWGMLIAVFLLNFSITAEETSETPETPKTPNATLPTLTPGYHWQKLPMVCAEGNTIFEELTAKGFVAVNMSLGRTNFDPKGEPVFLLTYFISSDGSSTAATMNVPISEDTCLLFVTHDLTITPQQ